MILSLLAGCSQQPSNKEVDVNEEGNISQELEITDMAGRTVVLSENVEKVFSTGAVGTILLYSLDPDKMVGWNYDLRDGEKRFIAEEYHDLPNLGGAGKESMNAEEVLKVDPDVLITMGKIDDTTISEVDEMQEQLGKPVVLLDDDIAFL